MSDEILDQFELSIASLREARRLPGGQELAVPVSTSALGDYRHALAARHGIDPRQVTDEMIFCWFAARQARPVFPDSPT